MLKMSSRAKKLKGRSAVKSPHHTSSRANPVQPRFHAPFLQTLPSLSYATEWSLLIPTHLSTEIITIPLTPSAYSVTFAKGFEY